MDFEKDNFEDDNELSRLEEEDELGGGDEIVETGAFKMPGDAPYFSWPG